MQYYDIDNKTRLPLEVINFISVYGLEAYVRGSSSKKGLHVKVDSAREIPIIAKWADKRHEQMKHESGTTNLWSDRATEWFRIKNFGVYAE